MIYFIQAGKTGAIKIGLTDNVTQRCKVLQAANYEKLKIIYSFEGNRKLESKFHSAFKKYRIRNEWYDKRILEDTKTINTLKEEYILPKERLMVIHNEKVIESWFLKHYLDNPDKLRQSKTWQTIRKYIDKMGHYKAKKRGKPDYSIKDRFIRGIGQ